MSANIVQVQMTPQRLANEEPREEDLNSPSEPMEAVSIEGEERVSVEGDLEDGELTSLELETATPRTQRLNLSQHLSRPVSPVNLGRLY